MGLPVGADAGAVEPPCGPDALGAEDVPDPTPASPVGTNALYNGPPDGTTCTCPDAPGGMYTLFLSWDGVWLSVFAMKSSAVLPLLVNSLTLYRSQPLRFQSL